MAVEVFGEDLEAAVRWAKRSEEALAKSLKHIQELYVESHHMQARAFPPEVLSQLKCPVDISEEKGASSKFGVCSACSRLRVEWATV